jgi:hypothetical protein
VPTVLKSGSLKPLTPELNPSAQSRLLRFFTGDFKFLKGSLRDVFLSRSALKGLTPGNLRACPGM